jgi:hypothetical protein
MSILGEGNRRDALHVDSAFKSGCKIFVTCDNGILSKRSELQSLLDIPFFNPDRDELELEHCLDNALSQCEKQTRDAASDT